MTKTADWPGSWCLINREGRVLGLCSTPEPKNHLPRQLLEHGFQVMGCRYDTFTIERMLLSKKQFPNPESVHELFEKKELGLVEKAGSKAFFGVVSSYSFRYEKQQAGDIFLITEITFVVGEKDVDVIIQEAPVREDPGSKTLTCPCCGAGLEVQLVKRGTSDVPPNA